MRRVRASARVLFTLLIWFNYLRTEKFGNKVRLSMKISSLTLIILVDILAQLLEENQFPFLIKGNKQSFAI